MERRPTLDAVHRTARRPLPKRNDEPHNHPPNQVPKCISIAPSCAGVQVTSLTFAVPEVSDSYCSLQEITTPPPRSR